MKTNSPSQVTVEMTEEELLQQLKEAEDELHHAKRKVREVKSQLLDAETNLINAKLHRDRVKEALRVHLATTPKYEPTKRDEDIEQFREKHPELVAWARQRDFEK